jgi:homoserine kinase type II
MAVYTKVSDAEAAEFLRAYDIGAFKTLAGIKQGVENSNYILETTLAKYILTLYEKRTKKEDLPFFLALMEYLAKKKIPCPLTVRGKDGEPLRQLAGRPVAVTTFLEGASILRVTPHECAELGRGLADMHLAGADFKMKRPNDLSLEKWKELLKTCEARADKVRSGLANDLRAEIQYLDKHWPKDLPSGIIHADLFPNNVFFKNGQLCGMIDFYFACNDLLAYDLAVCLNAWCFEGNNFAFNITKARALLKGYSEVRVLSDAERKALPVLARGAALRFHLTRLYDWLNQVPGAFVKPHDPLEYFTRLQFHQKVADVTAYGLEA